MMTQPALIRSVYLREGNYVVVLDGSDFGFGSVLKHIPSLGISYSYIERAKSRAISYREPIWPEAE